MLKKLDWYTIRTFLGPFFFIFGVLFFIFMVQFAWQELEKFAGKGLGFLDIGKLLFYSGLYLVQMVMPLTILLSSIMTFGGFGERYELAAMKSTGISLGRIMLPLLLFICTLSIGLYFFSDKVVPLAQKKGKNMLYNIASTRPAVNFEPGVFIMGVPGITMKIDDKSGVNGEYIKGVFIHKDAKPYENQQTIIAKNGLLKPGKDRRFLKLVLYEGVVYEDDIKGLSRSKLKKQPMRQIEFDTMVSYIDVSELVENAIDKESVTDHYKFMSSVALMGRIDTLKLKSEDIYQGIYQERISTIMPAAFNSNDSIDKSSDIIKPINAYTQKDKEIAILAAIEDIDRDLQNYQIQKNEIQGGNKNIAKHVLVMIRTYSNSLMCIAFFLIGAPLGAIIRKGGIGMPVVIAIIIFIFFYLIYMYSENLAKSGGIDPYWAAWSPVIVFFPLGLFFTFQAIRDSDFFNIEFYLQPFRKLISIFGNNKKEHARYQ